MVGECYFPTAKWPEREIGHLTFYSPKVETKQDSN
jgi:hypothetical protein